MNFLYKESKSKKKGKNVFFFLFTGRGGTRAGELCKITKNPNRTLKKIDRWVGDWSL